MDIQLITGKDVAILDTQQFPIVMNALLAAEAGQNQVPLLDLTVTSRQLSPTEESMPRFFGQLHPARRVRC